MTGVYRVPLRRVFKKTRADKGTTWDQVYGHVKCIRCKEFFKEGDPYRVVVHYKPVPNGKGSVVPVHKYEHVNECKERVVKKRVVAKPRAKQVKPRATRGKKS